MKIRDLVAWLESWSPLDRENRSDGMVYGDPDREVGTVAVSLLATPRVLREAAAAGASLLLVHEPTVHGGVIPADDPYMQKKRALLEEADIPVYRFHDHSHFTALDKINLGVLGRLGWEGTFDGRATFTLRAPLPLEDILRDVRERLGLHHLRYIGPRGLAVRTVATLFGAWGERTIYDHLRREEVDLVLAGEACEWSLCEYVRDAVELGMPRGLLLLGHMGSEREGMAFVAEELRRAHPALNVLYLDCGETYT